ncbi:MAG TPA: EVE domain-containing protein [Stellaceae bacterium]|jgi:predicted RNA-binding protein with PUA-like domain|nr:EVE domain-containing protein [Stellaceae bacterium]
MNYWLLKSEPDVYGWAQFVKDKRTNWSGVRNNAAALNLKAMKRGDRAFFYHSGEERRVVGLCEIVKEAYPDPSDATGRFVQVDVQVLDPLPQPVTLAAIKAEPKLREMRLVRESRLSVSPVATDAWRLICKMGGVKS